MGKILIFAAIILSGCASVAPQREALTNVPPLEKGWSRILVATGQLEGIVNVDLKFRTNTGSVYINGQETGSPAHKEHIAVDLLPGDYEIYWIPHEPDKFYSERKTITLKADETRYFTCDMRASGISSHLGVIGSALSAMLQLVRNDLPFEIKGISPHLGLVGSAINATTQYKWSGSLTERPALDNSNKPIYYLKFADSQISMK